MSGKDMMSGAASKPKVHRLPAVVAPKRKPLDILRKSPLFLLTALLVMVFAVSLSVKKPETVAVAAKPADNPKPITVEGGNAGQIQLADAGIKSLLPEKASKTIVIKGQAGVIIGQMARIPAEPEHITEIKTVSDIDNDAGRELLSIISKY